MFSLIYYKIQYPYFVWFTSLGICYATSRLSRKVLKYINNCSAFLSFKGTTYAYLLKISKTLTKNSIPLSYLLTNCISARPAPQILSLKVKYTLGFLHFLMIGLCYFSAIYWFLQLTALHV